MGPFDTPSLVDLIEASVPPYALNEKPQSKADRLLVCTAYRLIIALHFKLFQIELVRQFFFTTVYIINKVLKLLYHVSSFASGEVLP